MKADAQVVDAVMVHLVRRANPQPPLEDYPRILSAVVEAIADRNTEGAAEHLKPIAFPPRDVPARNQTTRALRVSTWRRDSPDCVLRCVCVLFADAFPYHRNWRGGLTHPAIPAIQADYTLDQLGWQLLDVSAPQWDGLTGYFPALWEAADRPDDQRAWLHLFAPTGSGPPHPPP